METQDMQNNMPFFQQKMQQQQNQQMCMNNNTYNNKTPNQIEGILPRTEKTILINLSKLGSNNSVSQNNNNYSDFDKDNIDVTLETALGFKVKITAPKNMTIQKLFFHYAINVGVPLYEIEKNIIFIHNGEKVDTNSNQPISYLFKGSNNNVTVLDMSYIVFGT